MTKPVRRRGAVTGGNATPGVNGCTGVTEVGTLVAPEASAPVGATARHGPIGSHEAPDEPSV